MNRLPLFFSRATPPLNSVKSRTVYQEEREPSTRVVDGSRSSWQFTGFTGGAPYCGTGTVYQSGIRFVRRVDVYSKDLHYFVRGAPFTGRRGPPRARPRARANHARAAPRPCEPRARSHPLARSLSVSMACGYKFSNIFSLLKI